MMECNHLLGIYPLSSISSYDGHRSEADMALGMLPPSSGFTSHTK